MKEFSRKGFVLLICVSLILDWNVVLADSAKPKEKKYKVSPSRCVMAAGVVALGAPIAAVLAGFGAGGIGAGTFAANMMSWSAISSGGGVSAGSIVAFLQSLGAKGLASFAMTQAGQALMAVGCLSVILEEDE